MMGDFCESVAKNQSHHRCRWFWLSPLFGPLTVSIDCHYPERAPKGR